MAIFRKDPCGIICMMMTYLAVFYADYVVVRWIVIQTLNNRFFLTSFNICFVVQKNVSLFYSLWGAFHAVVFSTIALLLLMSHLRAACSDPGIVPLPQSKPDFAQLHTGNTICFLNFRSHSYLTKSCICSNDYVYG